MKRLMAVLTVFLMAMLLVAPVYATNDKAVTVGGSRGTYQIMDYGDTSSDGAIELPSVKRALQQPKVVNLGLGDAFIVGTGLMGNDGTTAPGVAITDSIPKVIYASSAETAALNWNFALPNYNGGLVIKAMVSSSSSDYTGLRLSWDLLFNSDATVFGTKVTQTAVQPTQTALTTKNGIMTFTPNATALALVSKYTMNTLALWNSGSSDYTMEIIKVWVEYY